jgi:glutamyl-tRNA synthetase
MRDFSSLQVGEELTLLHWGNTIIDEVVSLEGKIVALKGHLNLEGDFKKTKKKLHWVPRLHDGSG